MANSHSRLLALGMTLGALGLPGSTAVAQSPAGHDQATRLIADARASFARVQDYTATLVRQERIAGQMQPEQFIELRVREKPFSVYLKWTSPKQFVGQEAMYVTGKNKNQMRAKGSGLAALAGYLSMPPDDPLAMKRSRHPITDTGIGQLTEAIARTFEFERRFPPSVVKLNFAEYAFQQKPCTRMEVVHSTNNGQFYCYRCVVFFDKEMKFPVRFEAYDWPAPNGNPNGELLECYSYINMKFNVGLTDAAFGNLDK